MQFYQLCGMVVAGAGNETMNVIARAAARYMLLLTRPRRAACFSARDLG